VARSRSQSASDICTFHMAHRLAGSSSDPAVSLGLWARSCRRRKPAVAKIRDDVLDVDVAHRLAQLVAPAETVTACRCVPRVRRLTQREAAGNRMQVGRRAVERWARRPRRPLKRAIAGAGPGVYPVRCPQARRSKRRPLRGRRARIRYTGARASTSPYEHRIQTPTKPVRVRLRTPSVTKA
jgi:hypothetical protein